MKKLSSKQLRHMLVNSTSSSSQKKVKTQQPLRLYVQRMMEGNVLFNDALNTFYLRLHDIRPMVQEHSARKNLLLPLHELLFPISSKSSYYMHHPTDMIAQIDYIVQNLLISINKEKKKINLELAFWKEPTNK